MMSGTPFGKWNSCPWMAYAESMLGVKEVVGPEANPDILAFHATTNLKSTSDEVAWCSAFVNWCIVKAGLVGTNSAQARSWLAWGQQCDPVPGAIGVWPRGNSTWMGHVGFVYGTSPGGYIRLLGGNQRDAVSIATFKRDSALGFRLPYRRA